MDRKYFTNFPGTKWNAFFSGKIDIEGPDKRVFVDRDPKAFYLIMNVIRRLVDDEEQV